MLQTIGIVVLSALLVIGFFVVPRLTLLALLLLFLFGLFTGWFS